MSLVQYEAVCKEQFEQINSKLDIISNKLFMDNGSPCMQTRLDRNERMWHVTVWVVAVISAASIAQVARSVYDHVREDRAGVQNMLIADPNGQIVHNKSSN